MLPRGSSALPARRRTTTAALLFVALVVTALTVSGFARGDGPSRLTRCETFRADSATRASEDSGIGPRVVVIGDSWSAGLGLDASATSWPTRLAGRVHVAGFSGSGFSELASECGQVSFADRARRAVAGGADLVVVEGGLNDYDRPDAQIRAGFARLMKVLGDRKVVIVGPATAPSRARQVPRVVATLKALAHRYGVRFIDASTLDLPYLPDRLHLTDAGHRAFGDYVAARL